MKALALLVVTCATLPQLAFAASGKHTTVVPNRHVAAYDESLVLHGVSSGRLSKAATDSFNLYGGVRSDGSNDRRPEGQFQTQALFPQDQGWTSVDLTENPTFWHTSTFNAANLDPAPSNRAMWSGVESGEAGYATAPGYGNGWDDRLEWRGQANPTIFTNVRLTFSYNYDVEPGYDFFHVDYDSAGVWINWLTVTGDNRDGLGNFTTPAQFDQTVQYTPFMLTGNPKRDVHIRMRVTSDPGWSDEDGLHPTSGAAQVDNVRVRFNGALVTQFGDGVASFEDLGGSDDNEGWNPLATDFVGDFAKVLPQLRDLDPCRTNLSPQLGFIDDGSAPHNAPGQSTGGSTSLNWSYGVIDGWVVNYNGGLTLGVNSLNNEWWSPEIGWDDPNSTEDDPLLGGAAMRWSVWQHLPLLNGIFWTWSVRSEDVSGYTPWQSRGFVYYGDNGGTYTNVQVDVSDLLLVNPSNVQMALGVIDLASFFAFPGTDSTPSPTFDNVSFWRYDLAGPAFSTREIDLFNDGFPNSGINDPLGNAAAMSVRIDMARDISTGTSIVPGDSIICDIVPTVPGSSLTGAPLMNWVLDANPLFDAVRTIPGTAVNLGPNPDGWDVWSGTVEGDSARTASGIAIPDRFFFDAPGDGPGIAAHHTPEPALFFPGDVFRYYLSAADTDGNTTTLPGDVTGFATGESYARTFTVRALPNVRSDGLGGVTQPEILVINDFGHRGGEATLLSAFGQNGMFEAADFDVYTTMGPSSLVSNGIGSAGAHGATVAQLAGYDCLLYESGNLASGLISDGSDGNGNDKGNDVAVLSAWHDLPGDRYMAHFGDNISSFLQAGGAASLTYLTTILAVDVADNDVRNEIGNQAAPRVAPSGLVPAFVADYIAYGGCLAINQFDSILPRTGAVTSHRFMNKSGGFYAASAAVWHARTQQINSETYNRVDVTFPYGFLYIQDLVSKAGPSARAVLLEELLGAFAHATNSGAATGADDLARPVFALAQNHPNPFNPSTEIRFTAPRAGSVQLSIYNVRGELVRTLLDGKVEAGEQVLRWDGRDSSGEAAGSGVYLYEIRGFGERRSRKMMLIK